MTVSVLDKVYRRMLLSSFFTKGWGKPEDMIRLFKFRKIMSNRSKCYELVDKNHPLIFINEEVWSDYHIIEGRFRTPLHDYLPELISERVQNAYFQMILPKSWKNSKHKPICIHLAGTGDHYFWRRRHLMAYPLLKNNIGSILLENPFYGYRKPREQLNSSLLNVTDIFVMGGCLMLECLVLLNWCEQNGFGPLGVTGLSMGGHMASLAATCWPKPLVLVPCLSWSTASKVFTEGVMSDSINWDQLQKQILEDDRYLKVLSHIDYIPGGQEKSCDNFQKTFFEVSNFPLNKVEKDKWNFLQYLKDITLNGKANMKKKHKKALGFMKKIMDECTHLDNFPKPFDTSLIIAVCASCDGYVPREGCTRLEDIWPGATIRYLNTGHVGAYLWHRKVFRKSIIEAFERAISRDDI